MFSGIVEYTSRIHSVEKQESIIRILVSRPPSFDDIKIGDSICTDGVCLTIESFTEGFLQFAIGPETLKITGWENLSVGQELNLERSLCFGDRIHGHLVTGHVDGKAKVIDLLQNELSVFFSILIPKELLKFVWKKGSLCINGVSLTINEVEGDILSFYLIPETLKRTNLKNLKVDDFVNIEVDQMAKAAVRYQELRLESHS